MEPAPGIAVEYIRYRIPDDRATDFIDAYRAAAVPLATSEYCLGHDLSHCAEDRGRFILRIQWTSIEDHLQRFRPSPAFRDFFSHVKPFVGQIEEMQHYTVVLTS